MLRRTIEGDAAKIFAYRSRRDVSEWIGGWATDLADFEERLGDGSTTVVVEHDGRVVGDLMVQVSDAWSQREVNDDAKGTQAELGWTFDPEHHGLGLATEAVRELIRLCLDDLGLRRVTAVCFTDNEPSWRLMERLGMRREAHHVRGSLHRDHGWLDEYVYALLADEPRG